jgi:hypothetical protein
VDSPRFRAGGEELDFVGLLIDSCKLLMTLYLDTDWSGEEEKEEWKRKKEIDDLQSELGRFAKTDREVEDEGDFCRQVHLAQA